MSTIKKKKVSKKKKSAWRKHVDITDVEDFLEEKRLEERLGKPFETRTDAEVFEVDVKPLPEPVPEPVLNPKQKRRLNLKPPRCLQFLQPLTNVPDPVIKRNRVRTKEERMHPIAKRREERRRLNGLLKHKQVMAAKNRSEAEQKKLAAKARKGVFDTDIWADKGNGIEIENNEWVDRHVVNHNLRGLGKPVKSVPKSITSKPSVLPSIEAPHPGMSYNPSLADHQQLLQEITHKEVKIMKEDEHLNRVTKKMFRRVSEGERVNSWMVEMSEGLSQTDKQDGNESNSDGEFRSVNPPVKNKEKDHKQRRKQREQRELMYQRQLQKTEKKKVADIYKLRFLIRELENREKKLQKMKERQLKLKAFKENEVKRLSSVKYEEPDLDVNAGEDIAGNLRNIKTEGNLLLDRYKSLQKRNILQPTAVQLHKRSKIKRYEKPNHKMGWEPKGY